MQYISTVLAVNAGPAVAGFKKGEDAANRYAGGLDKAAGTSDRSGRRIDRLSDSIYNNRAEWDKVGNSALIAGGAIAAGLGLAAREAIQWESAWAGVQKTVNGSTAEMAALEEDLRDLAKTLPATHEEIAGVAEAAGQLGIARGDILDFTQSAIDLGESTNLSAEEAATGLAKISNVMGTEAEYGIEGIERMGSTLVELGNNGASTESDILQMAQRLAGAGEQAGATEADVLALASSLSSVGVEAQLGGGAMSRAMLQMNTAVISGGDELDKFAEIAGMTSEEFATAWREDPVAAVGEFVAGLGRINEEGGDAAGALDDVGLAGTQNAQVLLRAAGASDLLTESLALGGEAWDENSALSEEAAQRYETSESRLRVAQNRLKDSAIDFGAATLPVLVGVAEGIASVADKVAELPEPVQSFGAATAGIAAGGLLIGGAAIKAIGFSQDLGDALHTVNGRMDRFGQRGPRTAEVMHGIGRGARAAAGGLAVLAAARVAAETLQDDSLNVGTQESIERIRESEDALEGLNGVLRENAELSGKADSTVTSLGEAARVAFDPTLIEQFGSANETFWEGITFGLAEITTRTEGAERAFGQVDDQLSELVANGNIEEANRLFDVYASEVERSGGSSEDFLNMLPGFKEGLAGAGNAQADAAAGAEEHTEALTDEEQAAQDAQDAIDKLRDSLEMLGGGFRAERAAVRSYEEALTAAKDVAKDSEATYADQQAALDEIAGSALDVVSSQLEMGRSSEVVAADLADARQNFVDQAVAYGMTEEAAKDLADAQGLIPPTVKTMFEAAGAGEATARVAELDENIELLSGKTVTVEEAGAMEAKGRVLEFDGAIFGVDDKTVEVTEIGSTLAGDRVVSFDGKIHILDGKTVEVSEEGATAAEGRVSLLDAAIGRVDGKQVNVGATVTGLGSLAALEARVSALSGGNVSVAVGTYKARKYGGIDHHDGRPHPMAGGGMLSPGAMMPGLYGTSSDGVLMAEDPSVPYEAYITPRADVRDQNVATLATVADDFGYALTKMQNGGTTGSEHFSRHYTQVTPSVTVQAPAAAGPRSETMAIIENLHGVTPEVAVRWAEQKQREANLSRRNT